MMVETGTMPASGDFVVRVHMCATMCTLLLLTVVCPASRGQPVEEIILLHRTDRVHACNALESWSGQCMRNYGCVSLAFLPPSARPELQLLRSHRLGLLD